MAMKLCSVVFEQFLLFILLLIGQGKHNTTDLRNVKLVDSVWLTFWRKTDHLKSHSS